MHKYIVYKVFLFFLLNIKSVVFLISFCCLIIVIVDPYALMQMDLQFMALVFFKGDEPSGI